VVLVGLPLMVLSVGVGDVVSDADVGGIEDATRAEVALLMTDDSVEDDACLACTSSARKTNFDPSITPALTNGIAMIENEAPPVMRFVDAVVSKSAVAIVSAPSERLISGGA
jgi:hypothetical protein